MTVSSRQTYNNINVQGMSSGFFRTQGRIRDFGRRVPGRRDVQLFLPKRPAEYSKADCGDVCIFAGASGMTGAAFLASYAALRSGVGLVRTATSKDNFSVLRGLLPETICVTPEEGLAQSDRFDALAFGPGFGVDDYAEDLLRRLLQNTNQPLVIDADGLTLLARSRSLRDLVRTRKDPVILTPHEGEAARLLTALDKEQGLAELTQEESRAREDRVRKLGQAFQCISLLKGHETLVWDEVSDRLYRNETGNPGMATAGSGDVLTGLIVSFLGQGIDSFRAACLGASIHGRAGDLARARHGEYGMIARDIITCIPEAIKEYSKEGVMAQAKEPDKAFFKAKALDIRRDIIRAVYQAGSGHPGGSLSAVDILTALFFKEMNIDPQHPEKPDRDKFVLSKGHAAPALYAALAELGYYPVEDMMTLRKLGSPFQGHPNMHKVPGVEMSTGSLGQGFSAAVGMAMANKMDQAPGRIYTLLGDGELNEGLCWEAAMAAAHYKLDNLTAFVDWNGLQIDGTNDEVMTVKPIDEKFRAFGWQVHVIDGHDFDQIFGALSAARTSPGRPHCILAKTHKGQGVSFMTDQVGWHGKAPDREMAAKAMAELGGVL